MLADSHGTFLGAFVLLWVLLVLVGLTVFVLAIVVTVQAYKDGRQGWWVYLIAVFISPLNLVSVIAWFAYLRKNPVRDAQGRAFL